MSRLGRPVATSTKIHSDAASMWPPSAPVIDVRRSAQRLPVPEPQVVSSSGLVEPGPGVDGERGAADDPAHGVGAHDLAGVVVGDVLQVAGGGIEPEASRRAHVAEPHAPAGGTARPAAGRSVRGARSAGSLMARQHPRSGAGGRSPDRTVKFCCHRRQADHAPTWQTATRGALRASRRPRSSGRLRAAAGPPGWSAWRPRWSSCP